MKKLGQRLLFLIASMMIPVALNAAVPKWEIIPAESKLSFTATQNAAPVTGEFKKFTGDIAFDVNNLNNSKADITIDISSVNASYADLTATLVTPDWFDTKLFPKAEFKSTAFSKTGDKNYQATGNLTIRNKTAPVTLVFTAEETPQGTMTVEGTTQFKRSTFGVGQGEWASTDEVKDEVTVNFKLIAKKKIV